MQIHNIQTNFAISILGLVFGLSVQIELLMQMKIKTHIHSGGRVRVDGDFRDMCACVLKSHVARHMVSRLISFT